MDLIFLYQFPSFLKKDVAAWYRARMVAFRVLISNALRRKEIRSSEARPAADPSGLGEKYRYRRSSSVKLDCLATVSHLPCVTTMSGEPHGGTRSEEHTSELQSLMRIS